MSEQAEMFGGIEMSGRSGMSEQAEMFGGIEMSGHAEMSEHRNVWRRRNAWIR